MDSEQDFLDLVAEKILSLKTNPQRVMFSQGLHASLDLQLDKKNPKHISAKKIELDFRISIADQIDYKISLTKKTAHEFLNEFGKSISEHKIRKDFTEKLYKETFNETPSKIGNALVLTYAEWLTLANHKFQPNFPQKLMKYKV